MFRIDHKLALGPAILEWGQRSPFLNLLHGYFIQQGLADSSGIDACHGRPHENFLCDQFHNKLGTDPHIRSVPNPNLARIRNIALAGVEEGQTL